MEFCGGVLGLLALPWLIILFMVWLNSGKDKKPTVKPVGEKPTRIYFCVHCGQKYHSKKVCTGCGGSTWKQKPLPPPPVKSDWPTGHDKQERKQWLTFWVFLACLVLLIVLLSCLVVSYELAYMSTPTPISVPAATLASTSTPTSVPAPAPTPTPTPTSMPRGPVSALTFREIEQGYALMTDLQWAEYSSSLSGTRVRWVAEVDSVGEDGTVFLDLGYNLGNVCNLTDIPLKVAITLDAGQEITFESTITSVEGTVFIFKYLVVRLDDTVILED